MFKPPTTIRTRHAVLEQVFRPIEWRPGSGVLNKRMRATVFTNPTVRALEKFERDTATRPHVTCRAVPGSRLLKHDGLTAHALFEGLLAF